MEQAVLHEKQKQNKIEAELCLKKLQRKSPIVTPNCFIKELSFYQPSIGVFSGSSDR
jgi:hypothetical protein